jgi:predicted Zn-dependent peptidase
MSINKHVFPNGLRIIYEKSTHKIATSHIYTFCDFGSAYEKDGVRGAAHFIEHMCFKGTHKLPSSKNLMHFFDEIGAYINAYTEKRYTCYTLKCNDEHINNSLKILSDMMFNSKFDKKEFKKEEKVVIEENIRDSDNDLIIIKDELNKLLYNGSSYAYPIDTLEYHKNLFDYKKVHDMYCSFYNPSNIVISFVSNLSFEEIKKFVESTNFIKTKPIVYLSNDYGILPYLKPQTGIQYNLLKKKGLNTTHICIGFRTLLKDKYKLNFLSTLLSNTFNSRLYLLLREKHGLTYTTKSYVDYNEITGDFYIYSEADYKKIIFNGSNNLGVFPILIALILDLIHNGVKQNEIKLTKSYLKGALNLSLENSDKIVRHNGYQFLVHPNDEIIPLSKTFETHYENITKKDIDNVIKTYIKSSGMSICILGDHLPSKELLQKICNRIK